MALVRRVAAEHRRLLVPLGLALIVNVALYGVGVYPLSQRVANVAQRDQAAVQELNAARREHAQASGALTGKARASAELATFYSDVLPQSLAGARRLTFLRLAQLARESNLGYERASRTPTVLRGSTLTQLKIDMMLTGTYADFRTFIYQLETAPEFVVIDNVDLAEGGDTGSLNITLALSTYYRDTAQ
jgi:Tfp pilus assembly protein PilO